MNGKPIILVLLLVSLVLCDEMHQLVQVPQEDAEVTEDVSPIESTAEVFIPTDDWQEVLPGQAIPAGLHVRINMQTGKKEAKLLVQEEEQEKSQPAESLLDPDQLKQALKNIKSDDKLREDDLQDGGEGRFDPSQYRSMDELKREFDDLQVKVKTDWELMQKLLEAATSIQSGNEMDDDHVNDLVEVLENLEYYVHQYDNAVDFVTSMKGLSTVVLPAINSTVSPKLRAAGCFLLGSAVQSNPKVQIVVYEAGFTNILLKLTTSDESATVSSRAFYALSALLRNFPEAQNSFMRQAGLHLLVPVFNLKGVEYDKLKIKVLTFLRDLMAERSSLDDSEAAIARSQQYKRVDFAEQVQKSGMCDVLPTCLTMPDLDTKGVREDMLSVVKEDVPLRVEHDYVEKVVEAINSLHHICEVQFRSNQDLMTKLNFLRQHYQLLCDNERDGLESGGFFREILQNIESLLSLQRNNAKTEL